ncbi:MAG TPA: hypothetical protein VFF10_00415 [Trueperaceae bacterium]|nr:hypothetical protein [Trueperaceae bacterium]
MLRFLSAGGSHGPSLTVVVDGVPAGLELFATLKRPPPTVDVVAHDPADATRGRSEVTAVPAAY